MATLSQAKDNNDIVTLIELYHKYVGNESLNDDVFHEQPLIAYFHHYLKQLKYEYESYQEDGILTDMTIERIKKSQKNKNTLNAWIREIKHEAKHCQKTHTPFNTLNDLKSILK